MGYQKHWPDTGHQEMIVSWMTDPDHSKLVSQRHILWMTSSGHPAGDLSGWPIPVIHRALLLDHRKRWSRAVYSWRAVISHPEEGCPAVYVYDRYWSSSEVFSWMTGISHSENSPPACLIQKLMRSPSGWMRVTCNLAGGAAAPIEP
jgi:hypothetical protein